MRLRREAWADARGAIADLRDARQPVTLLTYWREYRAALRHLRQCARLARRGPGAMRQWSDAVRRMVSGGGQR